DVLCTLLSTAKEPPPQRRTLVQRAGEPSKSDRKTHSNSRSVNPSAKSLSREPGFSSSVSSRTTSSSSNSSSVSSDGSRPSARNVHRPQTSFGNSPRYGNSSSRPATSMDTHEGSQTETILGKRKGT